MRYLLDTHAILFAAISPEELSERARSIFKDPKSQLMMSDASLWEIAILVSKKRIVLRGGFEKFVTGLAEKLKLDALPLKTAHFQEVADLPIHHKDPFDRLLAGQAITERISILSRDEIFDRYDVSRVW